MIKREAMKTVKNMIVNDMFPPSPEDFVTDCKTKFFRTESIKLIRDGFRLYGSYMNYDFCDKKKGLTCIYCSTNFPYGDDYCESEDFSAEKSLGRHIKMCHPNVTI